MKITNMKTLITQANLTTQTKNYKTTSTARQQEDKRPDRRK